MKTKTGWIFLLLSICFFLTGCPQWQNIVKPAQPSVCDEIAAAGRASYLCKMKDATGGYLSPERADFLLRLAVAVDLEKRKQDAPKIITICNEGINLLESNLVITYEQVAKWANLKVGPLATVVLGEAVNDMITLQIPVTSDDRAMLITHLKKQRALAQLVIA